MTASNTPEPTLTAEDGTAAAAFLRRRGWLPADAEVLSVAPAGAGNMNLVLRVRYRHPEAPSGEGSLILKQARPWVEKYPDIAAPTERLAVEADFYRCVAPERGLAARMPQLLAVDEGAHAACLEDLGEASDYVGLYAGERLPADDLATLLDWLSRLHALPVSAEQWPRLRNRAMRALNHAHIFSIPFDDGAPDADAFCAGLGAPAARLRADPAVRARIQELGAGYLADGEQLLHGDCYPGSWLRSAAGLRIIDPEFGFLGPAEFDLGVLTAHLWFAGQEDTDLSAYRAPRGFDARLMRGFAGAEILRRLLGVAQLPLDADLQQRERWLEVGRELLRA